MIYSHFKISNVQGKVIGVADLVIHHRQFTKSGQVNCAMAVNEQDQVQK